MQLPAHLFRRRLNAIRLRFSLRSLFVLITLVAIYLGISISRERREQEAVKAIGAVGGEFGYQSSYFYPFREVYVVTFREHAFSNDSFHAVVPHLQYLPGLTYLQIIQTSITDPGIKHLTNLRHLKRLELWDNNVTDAALPNISQMTSLVELDLSGTMISDNGLSNLHSMANLQKLTLPRGPTIPLWQGTTAATLAELGEELIEQQAIPGLISQHAVSSMSTTLPNCSVVLDKTWFYSGGSPLSVPIYYERQLRRSD